MKNYNGLLIAARQLARLAVNGFPLRHSWCVLYPRGKHLTPAGQRFLDHLLASGADRERATETPARIA